MNKPDLIQMMNEKLDELTQQGVPFFVAKLIVAKAMIETLERLGVDKSAIVDFARIIAG